MKRFFLFALVTTFFGGFLFVGVSYADELDWWIRGRTIEVDIAENGTRFLPDAEPTNADGLPAYGSEFITEGYIYPAGTVTCVDNVCNGVNPDGSPEFPDLVLGTWTCRGWHVGEGADTVSGPAVVTTQTFAFGANAYALNIVTDGFETLEFDQEIRRAIVGGTGRYRFARGEQRQTLLGWNDSIGVVTTVTLQVR